jgi:hypothetical protein
MYRDSKFLDRGHIGIISSEVPDNDLRSITLPVYRLKKTIQLMFQTAGA